MPEIACLALGATNAREARIVDRSVETFHIEPTPTKVTEFYGWLARRLLDAADDGVEHAVIGVPGPVVTTPAGIEMGPMTNIGGGNSRLAKNAYNVNRWLRRADPGIDALPEDYLHVVNDGDLAGHAVGARFGTTDGSTAKHRVLGALINGSGVGLGVVSWDAHAGLYRRMHLPLEIGKAPYDDLSNYEQNISGTALSECWHDVLGESGVEWVRGRDLPANHQVWADVGNGMGRLSMMAGTMLGAEVIVPTGGVGIGAREKYQKHLDGFVEGLRELGNDAEQRMVPEIRYVPAGEEQTFELLGASGIVREAMHEREAANPPAVPPQRLARHAVHA